VSIHNREIAEMFHELADLLEIQGANPFRVRAYRNAARVIEGMSRGLADLVDQGADLSALPNIGKEIARKIEALVRTGELPALEEARRQTPGTLSTIMKLAGLGPKRVKALHERLSVDSLEDLRRAAASGRVRELPGFGPKTEATILARLERWQGEERRTRLIEAEEIVRPLVAYLEAVGGVERLAVAGSFRRRMETVGDLDILVSCARGSPVVDRFAAYDEVVEVVSRGDTRSTVVLHSGMQVDLRVVPQVSFGAALHYFTGSKAHNIAVRRLGVRKGLKINEYGVFRGARRIAGRTEKEVYRSVGLPYVAPELREARGEIEAGRGGRLPGLVEISQIRGDLHAHTKATDGHDGLPDMAEAAAALGYEYLAITDHSRHATVAQGLDEKRLAVQMDAIDRLNDRLDGRMTLLKGIELDILADGSLDLPGRILRRLDITLCSIHYKFDLPRRRQTERVLRAMDSPYFHVLAHPSGRLIGQRDAYDIDLERIMDAAAQRGCFLELNAQPSRLDLGDAACRMAKDKGVKVAVSTDAHSTGQLDYMRFGIGQARRGWLESGDIINTRRLRDLQRLLNRG
jgi:DNA polymerase (family 10)